MATIPQAGKDRDWVACLRRVMASAWWGHDVSGIEQAPAVLNGEYLTAVNAAGTGTVNLIGTSGDSVVVAGSTVIPGYKTVTFMSTRVGIASGRPFWVSDGSYTIVGVQEIHATAETTAATLSGAIQKSPLTGVAVSLNVTSFNMKSTANTLQTSTVWSNFAAISPGDRLLWSMSGTGTEVAGIAATVILAPGNRNNQAYSYFTNALATDGAFFVATRSMTITRIDYIHSAPASAACNVQVTLDTSTNAPGAGTDILSNNSGSGFDCATSSGVVQTGTLVTAATRMSPGDRLSCDWSGTTTGLLAPVIVVTFAPSEDRREVTYQAQTNANHVDGVFFIADRAYQVEFSAAVWSTAAAAGNAQLTIDSGTQAPGGGVDLLSMDTNAGFQIDGPANTVEVGTFISPTRNFLQPGDRLSIDFSAAATIVGFVCTVTLRNA